MSAPTPLPPAKGPVQAVLGQWPLALVLSGVAVGLFVVAVTGHWRVGCTLIGASVTLGGILRLMPNSRVGLLAVRSRLIDTVLLLGSGVGIVILTWVMPLFR
jgi:Protein of unknown function (DUF3017).